MGRRQRSSSWITNDCSSGKRAYVTMADARKVATTRRRRGVEHLSAYQCDECEMFHTGHLPRPVVRGDVPRYEIRQPINRRERRNS